MLVDGTTLQPCSSLAARVGEGGTCSVSSGERLEVLGLGALVVHELQRGAVALLQHGRQLLEQHRLLGRHYGLHRAARTISIDLPEQRVRAESLLLCHVDLRGVRTRGVGVWTRCVCVCV